MRAFVITLKGNKYSEKKAAECIKSASRYIHGPHLEPEIFYGVDKEHANQVMKDYGLKWTWAHNNNKFRICPITKLQQKPYGATDIRAKIGCSMSHFQLWRKCVEINKPILILEHDSVFIRYLPAFNFKGLCMINDPDGATRNGKWWSNHMKKRETEGVHKKTLVPGPKMVPDGLAGNSAYLIKPFAAQELVDKFYELGVWPNDATMCVQLFPYLEEYYPFITKVNQTYSTSKMMR